MVSGKANSSPRGSDCGARKRARPPLGEAELRDLALSYVARFASTGARLEAYLARKLKERGVALDADGREARIDVPALVARLVELGYVDDAAYARMRARDLGARGYGARRVEQALWAAGVDETIRDEAAPGEAARRRAAALMAQKRRLGPYGAAQGEAADPLARRKAHEKAVAAMLRAGHDYEDVRFILAAGGTAEVEAWLGEAESGAGDQEGCEGSW